MEEGTEGGPVNWLVPPLPPDANRVMETVSPTAGVLPIPPAALGKAVLAQEDLLISAQLLQQGMRMWAQESM